VNSPFILFPLRKQTGKGYAKTGPWFRFLTLLFLLIQQCVSGQNNTGSKNTEVAGAAILQKQSPDSNLQILSCFDFYSIKNNPDWSKDIGTSKTYIKNCDLAVTSIVLNADFTFFCLIQTGGVNWIEAGRWKVTRDSILFLRTDPALSGDFKKSFINEKNKTYSIAKIADSTYLCRKNHLIPMVLFGNQDLTSNSLPANQTASSNKTGTISGRVSRTPKSSDGVADMKLTLVAANGQKIQKAKTDQTGFFRFNPLPADQNYSITLDDDNAGLKPGSKFYLLDSKGRIISVTIRNADGKFEFKNLPADVSVMEILPESETELKGNSISGNFLHGPKKEALANVKISLLNPQNAVVSTTMTNIFGAFLFMGLSSGEDYTIAVQVNDPVVAQENIYLVDKTGKVLQVGNAKTGFRYSILKSDAATLAALKEEDTDLNVTIKGKLFLDSEKARPLKNAPVDLLNNKGQVAQTCKTDDAGAFRFSHKFNKESYILSINDSVVPAGEKKEIYLADEQGKILEKMISMNGKFSYEILPNIPCSMTEIVVEDPWLDLLDISGGIQSQTIVEKVYFNVSSFSITPEAEVILNKVIGVLKLKPELKIELGTHTDSRGSDAFNLQLSQKRADAVVKYMLSKGLPASRVSGVGYGETKLLNKCANGVICTDEEHAMNRRAEFKISRIK
jgi:outer membrane protein OmpA-like peptidoglycan-associated protein